MEKILRYKSNAFEELLKKYNLKKTNISKRTFGQTNNKTVNRWLNGEDIYFTKLISICNDKKIDLLSFLEFEGKAFRSTLMDVIALEEQGMSVRELMQKQEKELCVDDKNTFITLSSDFCQPNNGTVDRKLEETKKNSTISRMVCK